MSSYANSKEKIEVDGDVDVELESLLPDHAGGSAGGFPRRYILVAFLFCGLFIVYGLRICISVAAAPSAHAHTDSTTGGTSTNFQPESMYDEFGWSTTEQGIVLGAFFNGYITSQIVGGILSRRYGGKVVLAAAVLLASFFTGLTPVVAFNLPLLVACRVMTGVVEGVSFPAIVTAKERSTFMGIVFGGAAAGNVVTLPLSALLLHSFGWRWIFFVYAIAGLVWTLLFCLFTASTPAAHSSISPRERHLLHTCSPPQKETRAAIPWLRILRCKGAWACFVGHTCFNWGFYTLLTQLPSYLSLALQFDLEHAGFVSSLPYLAMLLFSVSGGVAADAVMARGWLSRTRVRKVWMVCAMMLPALLLVCCGYAETWAVAVMVMTLSVGLSGLNTAGANANYLDLAPTLGGVVFCIGNTFATIPGMVSPVLSGMIVDAYGCDDEHVQACKQAYQAVFWVVLGVCAFGSTVYGLFATAEAVLREEEEEPQ
eukprot:CAMPEP_0181307150 /NCGR_PEP_ID=MMETSP1101-20121128/10710_1 /TAXON_ID=46948 /ORGANISM="Rhodomonas abbreviata, Strain Caron Lab Isolate" /LENGTH=483 /DNA_ID=CAMNT_0023413315 /DNA_START=100 /DNA_END=1552 /DNA_ORIENTATION=-